LLLTVEQMVVVIGPEGWIFFLIYCYFLRRILWEFTFRKPPPPLYVV
jgi:hypothetical protein